jgi:hypothetical protein
LQLGKLANGQAKQIEAFRKPPMADLFTGELAPEKSGPAWDMFMQLTRAKSQKEVAEFFAAKAEELSGQGKLFQGAANRVEELITRKPTPIIPTAVPMEQEEAEKVFGEWKDIQSPDGFTTIFPKRIVGKIKRHRGFNVMTIIADLRSLFEDSIYIGPSKSKGEYLDGSGRKHKDKPNIDEYKNYVNKFTAPDGSEYYIRFTSQVERVSRKRINSAPRHELHSTAISEVRIYKTANPPTRAGLSTPGEGGSAAFVDKILSDFLDSVNPETSSGPPVIETLYQPGYHGSPHRFDRFSLDAIGAGEGAQVHGTTKNVKMLSKHSSPSVMLTRKPASRKARKSLATWTRPQSEP